MLRKKLFRDVIKNKSQFIAIFLMVLLGVMVYGGVRSYMDGMQITADVFYKENNLQDLTVIGSNFSKNDLDKIKKEALHREGIEEKTEFVTRKQIASYGMVAREYLKHTGNLELSNEQFGEYILTLLDLYSPVEVEKEAEKIKDRK